MSSDVLQASEEESYLTVFFFFFSCSFTQNAFVLRHLIDLLVITVLLLVGPEKTVYLLQTVIVGSQLGWWRKHNHL